MTYIIVKDKATSIGKPFDCYFAAMKEAGRRYGTHPKTWMDLNLRVEENR